MKPESRKNLDWSKHDLIINKTKDVTIHHLKKPDTTSQNVKFTNFDDVLVVTGSYGNYIFCKSFYPNPEGRVSDDYWLEKLTMNSCQEPEEFDPEGTIQEIDEKLKNPDLTEEEKEYFEDIKSYVDEPYDGYYIVHSIEKLPKSIDYDDVPHIRKIISRLLYVFDAFEEICRRLKK